MGMPQLDKSMKGTYEFHPAIPLAYPIRLGAIGVLVGGVFDYKGSLQGLTGIDIGQIRPPMPTPNPSWRLDSGKNVTLRTKLAGETTQPVGWLPKAQAGVSVTFGSENSFVFAASDVDFVGLDEEALVEEAVLDFYEANKKRWNSDWIIVTELAQASSALVILARQANTTVELAATGDITAAVSIADLSVGLELAFSSSSVDHQIAGHGPVGWRGFRIDDRWLAKPRTRTALVAEPDRFEDVYQAV